ncbi:Pyruvate decarboxylase [Pseudocercospora fuligena]|uniref:Pyruvate decarboxylase n=1 Tax=Pseudocercospora fuligena TaxID=685502 RepID=A0A8H6VM40_9PEZI|nr:Pyruvate decarboxylase [Pseudocercospora fuligena]
MAGTITLAEYLFARLKQLGSKSLHGLPGDFNLTLLDYVESSGLTWVGLGNGDFRVFARIHKEITIAQADLIDLATAPAEIDRVLRTCYIDSQPVYLQIPMDMVHEKVDATLLNTAIDVSPHPSSKEAEDLALQIVLEKLYAARKPVFLVDGAAQRRRILPAVHALIAKAQFPVFTAPMGKGAVDEDLPNFVGVYSGAGSHPEVAQALESSDLIITIGTIQSDLNTVGFTYQFSKLNKIDIEYDCVQVGYAKFEKVFFKSFIPRLAQLLDPSKLSQDSKIIPRISPPTPIDTTSETITHRYLWPQLASFLRDGDFLITDTGTSFVGVWETRLPRNCMTINQILWSSIGYGVGAAQGAALAARELGKGQRVICFEGDGSFQLTAQELSTIIRHDLDVTMFVIENDGYEIERWIHGWDASYNDIPQWQYSKLPEVLTLPSSKHKVRTWKISTRSELEGLLKDPNFADGKGLQLVEMHMPRGDAPKTLRDFAERRNGVSATKAFTVVEDCGESGVIHAS